MLILGPDSWGAPLPTGKKPREIKKNIKEFKKTLENERSEPPNIGGYHGVREERVTVRAGEDTMGVEGTGGP